MDLMDIIVAVSAVVAALSVVASVVVAYRFSKRIERRIAGASAAPESTHLPVVNGGSGVRAIPRQCSSCKHFDLEEGQRAIEQHPAFMMAARHLAPSQMGLVVEYEDCPDCVTPGMSDELRQQMIREAIESKPEDRCEKCGGSTNMRLDKKSDVPAKARWQDFGACMLPREGSDDGELRWNQDVCGDWSIRADG